MPVQLSKIPDLDALAQRWRALECRADHSFFQSWTLLGCQAETRFKNATLVSAGDNDGDSLLALISRGRLNETGDPVQDSLFMEHNGPLVRRGGMATATQAFRAILAQESQLTLSGITSPVLDAARNAGWLGPIQARPAPFAQLPRQAENPIAALPHISANLRAQLRRAFRLYGPALKLTRAQNLPQAEAYFAELTALHQDSWQARGEPGAFAAPATLSFHASLIARGHPRGEIDLLRIAAGAQHVGMLYLFTYGQRAMVYQTAFVRESDNRLKPGLVCHALAMAHYARSGFAIYDFLAGDARYKRSLTTGAETLYWTQLHKPWSGAGLAAIARSRLQQAASQRAKRVTPEGTG